MGLSASQVAARMNAEAREQLFTRNSIVGKVSRLCIPMRNADMGKRRTSDTPASPRRRLDYDIRPAMALEPCYGPG
jgi:hypothetical protein